MKTLKIQTKNIKRKNEVLRMKPNFFDPDNNLPVKNDNKYKFENTKMPSKMILVSFCMIKSDTAIEIKCRTEIKKRYLSGITLKFPG
ncbi:MAG: hypothetical protein M3P82_06645 [Bacteroidota bacterium]|nr:hypothetical protein [Bacteroidota bacterium]